MRAWIAPILFLVACGGKDVGQGDPDSWNGVSSVVGGTVTGLGGSGLILQNNGGDDLTITANGSFVFAKPVPSGTSFAVTVRAQPLSPLQTCLVSGGSGAVGDQPITTVVVDCWTNLISRKWSLGPAPGEGYRCTRIQVPTDMWINAFRAMSPVGTHHEVLTIDPSGTAVGDYDCNAGTGAFNSQMVYAAGVLTDDLAFPTGIAVHLIKGTWINLNLHLFNLKDVPAADESGLLVKTIPAADVVHEADMTFAGTYQINIPSDNTPHTAAGGCLAPAAWHLFTLWPHMHQTAVHQTFVVTHAGTPTTMLDTDYVFGEQKNYPMPETVLSQGDQIRVTCTYVNNTGATITFGDSSTKEMCFTGMYKYPAGGGELGCVN
jgi:hypothetical protein